MAPNKLCSLKSNNMQATLIVLICLSGVCVWFIVDPIVWTLTDPAFRQYVDEYSYICYVNILIGSTGLLLFLLTIVFVIIDNKFCASMLKAAILFILLYIIYKISSTFLYNSNGALDKYFDAEVEKQLQKIPYPERDQRRSELQKDRPTGQKLVFNVLKHLLVACISIGAFGRYVKELEDGSG